MSSILPLFDKNILNFFLTFVFSLYILHIILHFNEFHCAYCT